MPSVHGERENEMMMIVMEPLVADGVYEKIGCMSRKRTSPSVVVFGYTEFRIRSS